MIFYLLIYIVCIVMFLHWTDIMVIMVRIDGACCVDNLIGCSKMTGFNLSASYIICI